MTLADALDRTLLLIRDEVGNDLSDDVLIQALTSTSVVLVADKRNLRSHSAQTALVTAAMLMARSAHRVFIVAPDTDLVVALSLHCPRDSCLRASSRSAGTCCPGSGLPSVPPL